MNVTVDERLNILNLFNVSEAAREVGLAVDQMHGFVKSGKLPKPTVKIGKRRYYKTEDVLIIKDNVMS